MPKSGYYEKIPRPESIAFFIKTISGRDDVIHVDKINEITYMIVRDKGKKSLKVFLTNIYIVSLVDVIEIMSEVENIDAIITMSAWNGYSDKAKEHAKNNNVGLFKFGEFMGAMRYSGNRFLDYVPPEKRRY